MTIKRALLLLSAMAAFAAFAAPAAQAQVWWTSDGNTEEGTTLPGAAEKTPITGTGDITSHSATGLTSGPCQTHVTGGNAWNGESMGEGEITGFTITPCATNVPGCNVVAAHNNASVTNPWPVTLTTTDTVDVSNVTFTNTYAGASCAAAGIPAAVSATGTVTGTLENAQHSDGRMIVCVNLNNYTDHFKVESGGAHTPISVNLTGSFCIDRTNADITFEHQE